MQSSWPDNIGTTVALKLDKMCIHAREVGLLLFTELVSSIICTIFYKKVIEDLVRQET